MAPNTHTTQPIVTGSTVIGMKYADGVMLASDTLASYGSLARYNDVQRVQKVGDNILLGASGEISDFQAVLDMLEAGHRADVNQDDGYSRAPAEVHGFLRNIMYNRRNKGNPLWNQFLLAGYKEKPFLGYVDLIGTAYEEDFIATGFGAYMAIPLLREGWRADLSEAEARALLEQCLRVLFYRDCRASSRVCISVVKKDGVVLGEPFNLSQDWACAEFDFRQQGRGDGSSW